MPVYFKQGDIMKKSLLVVAALGIMGVSASAAELSPACEEYFKLVDEFVEKTKDNPQMAAMKSTYEDQKINSPRYLKMPKRRLANLLSIK